MLSCAGAVAFCVCDRSVGGYLVVWVAWSDYEESCGTKEMGVVITGGFACPRHEGV
jgi:hypothetical protein